MRRAVFSALTAILCLAVFLPCASAVDLPYYGDGTARTRTAQGTQSQVDAYYTDTPLYIEFPSGQKSFSTPTVVGSTLYQYTFAGTTGYLHALSLPLSENSTKTISLAGSKGYVAVSAAQAQSTLTFPLSMSGGINEAAGQDSLTTGPYFAGSPSGNQYQAIGVGKKLYIWAKRQWPSVTPNGHSIKGNHGNNTFQIDENPLITPPVTLTGTSETTGSSTTWSAPVAVVGSWDGGLLAYPTHVPSGVLATRVRYKTSQEYANSSAALTSDPTWVGPCSVGLDCVAFGVAGSHPRVVLLDVTNGNYTDIGLGTIGTQVASPPVYDSELGVLLVQDTAGTVYEFSVSGSLIGSSSVLVENGQPVVAKDMNLVTSGGEQWLFAEGAGGSRIGLFFVTATGIHSMGVDTKFGPHAASTSSVGDTSGNMVTTISNENGRIWLLGLAQMINSSTGDQHDQNLKTPVGSGFIGYVPGVGPNGWLIGWTNSDPNGLPAVVVYVQTPLTISGYASPKTVQPGSPVALTAVPDPYGISQPVQYAVFTATKSAPKTPVTQVQGWVTMHQQGNDEWTANWLTPTNTTGHYFVAEFKAVTKNGGETATDFVPFTVQSSSPSPPPSSPGGGNLKETCGYGAGTATITVPHTCTLGSHSGEPASYFRSHPNIGAKFGDTLSYTLTIPQPTLPSCGNCIDEKLSSIKVNAKMHYTKGVPNLPGQPGYNSSDPSLYHFSGATMHMTQTGQRTAKGYIVESWAGYPSIYVGTKTRVGQVVWSGDMKVQWTAQVNYSYTKVVSGTYCKPPLKKGGKPQCHSYTDYYPNQHGSFLESGTASAPLVINGSDYYTITTPLGY